MGKISASKLRALAKKYGTAGIVTDDYLLRCDYCSITIQVDDKHQAGRVEQHIVGPKHLASKARVEKNKTGKQPFLANAFKTAAGPNLSEFSSDLAGALVQSGIPLNKVNNKPFKNFLEKYTKHSVPHESTLRKNYVQQHVDASINRIREVVGESSVYFEVDETTDEMKRCVLNVLVGPLTGEPTQSMLLKLYSLEKVNASTVMQSVNDACSVLWPDGIKYDRVLLLVSDQVAYMLAAGRQLKALFPQMKHVSCLAHALHLVCESIRMEYLYANHFISAMKKTLKKSRTRIDKYRQVTQLPFPPDPVITRWGTWIMAGSFYAENFTKIIEFINSLDVDAACVKQLKKLACNKDVETELFAVHSYKYLTESITKLEKPGRSTEKQWSILCEAQDKLDGFAKEKLQNSLSKNPDLKYLVSVDSPLDFRIKTKFAPLISVDVERSFSQYRDTLSSKRHRFTFQNLSGIMIVRYNRFLWDIETSDNDDVDYDD